jgi:hypothetical protein
MLSMVMTIFEMSLTNDEALPEDAFSLYTVASKHMLERVDQKQRDGQSAVSAIPHLSEILEHVALLAHAAHQREISESHFHAAANILNETAELPGADLDASVRARRSEPPPSDILLTPPAIDRVMAG